MKMAKLFDGVTTIVGKLAIPQILAGTAQNKWSWTSFVVNYQSTSEIIVNVSNYFSLGDVTLALGRDTRI